MRPKVLQSCRARHHQLPSRCRSDAADGLLGIGEVSKHVHPNCTPTPRTRLQPHAWTSPPPPYLVRVAFSSSGMVLSMLSTNGAPASLAENAPCAATHGHMDPWAATHGQMDPGICHGCITMAVLTMAVLTIDVLTMYLPWLYLPWLYLLWLYLPCRRRRSGQPQGLRRARAR